MSKTLINFATKISKTVLPDTKKASPEIFTKFINGKNVPCIKVDGKLVEITSAQAEAISKTGKVVNHTPVSSPLERVPATDTVSISTPKSTIKTTGLMPEGMKPEELKMVDIRRIMKLRYNSMRYKHNFAERSISKDATVTLSKKIYEPANGISIDNEVEWVYRKPSWMKDRIKDFIILPKERISMNVNADPRIIEALDRYISKGEVLKDGKVIKTVTPPKAYYKVDSFIEEGNSFFDRTDPFTMYFREPVTEAQLKDITTITEPFKCTRNITSLDDPLFAQGQLKSANWLSYSKEHSPEDLYELYKRAQSISPTLAEAIDTKVVKGGAAHLPGLDYGKDLPSIERFRYRISEGTYYSIESVVNDFEKALGG